MRYGDDPAFDGNRHAPVSEKAAERDLIGNGGIRLKIKIFNREICVRALLDTNSLCAKSSAEMR